jgi:hypothetical protein
MDVNEQKIPDSGSFGERDKKLEIGTYDFQRRLSHLEHYPWH